MSRTDQVGGVCVCVRERESARACVKTRLFVVFVFCFVTFFFFCLYTAAISVAIEPTVEPTVEPTDRG